MLSLSNICLCRFWGCELRKKSSLKKKDPMQMCTMEHMCLPNKTNTEHIQYF